MQHFLMTYTVKAQTGRQSDIDKAEAVRRQIANIKMDKWEKTPDVETTFWGEIPKKGATDEEKMNAACDVVESLFMPILEEEKASIKSVKILCAMMISSMTTPFTIEIYL
ncbi:hypothetical protein B2M27_23945 [Kluyvera intermedia]|uniref:Uncharacterized protein n=1 Tax=Kluyvera intermedia TaxID=61648 RepID=A0ABX3U8E3_KLUIN|nr:hypothetical protein [Kluyvera intermedia]ORJ47806.1 hypothetical protein B2M27_23945 [Kluyvera intermedia]